MKISLIGKRAAKNLVDIIWNDCACWCVSSHHSTLHLSLHNFRYVSPSPQYAGLKLCGTLISARGIPAMDANGLMASNR